MVNIIARLVRVGGALRADWHRWRTEQRLPSQFYDMSPHLLDDIGLSPETVREAVEHANVLRGAAQRRQLVRLLRYVQAARIAEARTASAPPAEGS